MLVMCLEGGMTKCGWHMIIFVLDICYWFLYLCIKLISVYTTELNECTTESFIMKDVKNGQPCRPIEQWHPKK